MSRIEISGESFLRDAVGLSVISGGQLVTTETRGAVLSVLEAIKFQYEHAEKPQEVSDAEFRAAAKLFGIEELPTKPQS